MKGFALIICRLTVGLPDTLNIRSHGVQRYLCIEVVSS